MTPTNTPAPDAMPELKLFALEYYKPPFQYEPFGQTIYCQGANGQTKCLDVRGWGNLTGGGANALPIEKAEHVQDEFGHWVADTLNANLHHTALEQVARQMAEAQKLMRREIFYLRKQIKIPEGGSVDRAFIANDEALAAYEKLMEGKCTEK